MTAPHDVPGADELVRAVREFIERDVMGATDGRVRFHARVAVNVLGMVERELAMGPSQREAHAAALAQLGMADDAELAAAIRDGRLDDRRGGGAGGRPRDGQGEVGRRPSRVHRRPVSDDRGEAADGGQRDDELGRAIGDLAGGRQSGAGGLTRASRLAVESMRTAGTRAVGSGRWLAEALIDAAPRVPVRDPRAAAPAAPHPRAVGARGDPIQNARG